MKNVRSLKASVNKSSFSEKAFCIDVAMDMYKCETSEEVSEICKETLDIEVTVEEVSAYLEYRNVQEESAFFEYVGDYTIASNQIFN